MQQGGTNFSLWAPEATGVEVCLFDAAGAEVRHRLVDQTLGFDPVTEAGNGLLLTMFSDQGSVAVRLLDQIDAVNALPPNSDALLRALEARVEALEKLNAQGARK